MSISEFQYSALPEWYRVERETEKTINKLSGVKELDYYLCNPDESIRRLAILRLQKISAKDSAKALRDLLDDPVESNENKYLAAWALKSILSSKELDFYSNNFYLNKFNGNERFEDLFIVTAKDAEPSVRFDFSSSEAFRSIKMEKEDAVLEKDIFFETDFDMRKWSSMVRANLGKSLISCIKAVGALLLGIPLLIGKAFASLFKKLSSIRLQREARKGKAASVESGQQPDRHERRERSKQQKQHKPVKQNDHETQPGYSLLSRSTSQYDYTGLRRELYKKPGFFSLLKKGGFQLLYFLFAPFRFVRKHKIAFFGILVAVYLLLAYTEYGRAFTSKYMAFDMRNVPVFAINKAKEYSQAAMTGLNKLTGLEDYKKKTSPAGSKGTEDDSATLLGKALEEGRLFLVTAQKGLNMRKSPDPDSERVGNEPLPYGSTVIYLSKSESDASGKTWYYVEAKDGRSGWVSAKYLKEKKEG